MNIKKSIGTILTLFIAALVINIYADTNKDTEELSTYEFVFENNTDDLFVFYSFETAPDRSRGYFRGDIILGNVKPGTHVEKNKDEVRFPIEYELKVRPLGGDRHSFETAKGKIETSSTADSLPLNLNILKGYKVDYEITYDEATKHGKYVLKIEKEGNKELK